MRKSLENQNDLNFSIRIDYYNPLYIPLLDFDNAINNIILNFNYPVYAI